MLESEPRCDLSLWGSSIQPLMRLFASARRPPGPVGAELHRGQEPHQHGAHPGPQAGNHLRLPGARSHRGGVWTLQREALLPDHDRG